MTTRFWFTAAGGDWQTGTWYVSNGGVLTASTGPVSGDTLILQQGNVTFSAADATSFGPIAGLDIVFEGTPNFAVTGGTINAGSTIETRFSNTPGSVSFSGNDSVAGLLKGAASTGALTVAIQTAGTVSLASTGTILARNGGVVSVTGATGARLVSAGTIEAGISLGGGAFEGGSITISSALTNTGTIFATTFGTLSLKGVVTYSAGGTITDAGGLLTIGNGLVNFGVVQDTSGTLSVAGIVSGTGTIVIADSQTLTLSGGVQAGQTISFATGVGTLDLGSAASFAGTVTGLSGHDIIDLTGVANATATVSAGNVTISAGGSVVATFAATGLTGPLNSVSDGNGGTILTLKDPGAEASVVNTEVNGANGTSARAWGAGGTIVTYSFDSGSNWTTAEKAAFVNGLGLWSAVANITFTQASSGAGQLVFTRGTDFQAYSANTTLGSVIQSDTVSIDTRVGSWQNLSGIGTLDTTGYGGYGWSTILHEEGHVLGLNHPGNYNETADLATQQTYYTDTHQYSVMSYFDASQSGANWSNSGTAYQANTPMLFDIAAAQQIYGVNKTTLSGNDTFGFHASSSITNSAALDAVYDFTKDTLPIETIWDGGTNNTLDLSGYSSVETINLNAGGFSNVNGLTSNLAIAYGTTIDTAIGGSGNDVFIVNADSDRIDGGGGANTAVFASALANYAIANNAGTVTVTALSGGAVDTLTNVQTLTFSDTSVTACFVTGTRIMTAHGEIAVEELQVGDLVATLIGGGMAPIRWIGRRTVDAMRHPFARDIQPVRVAAGAFGAGLPIRDLLLSPEHAVFAGGVLIAVRHLVNGTSITQLWRDSFTYWHVELDRHDVILADGLAVESYLENDNRHDFEGELDLSLHPMFQGSAGGDPCAPIVSQGCALEAVRRSIATASVREAA